MNNETNRILDPSIPPFYYFEEISKIPHGSYNEQAIADYVENNAKALGLRYVRDDNNVIIVYVPALATLTLLLIHILFLLQTNKKRTLLLFLLQIQQVLK